MKTIKQALGALVLLGGAAVFLNTFAPSDSLNFDPARLSRINTHYTAAIADQQVVGARAVIFQNNKIVYAQNWGYADQENKKPLADDTILHFFSMTKPITSVAVMMLFEEGKFLLHDPIAKYIPELANLQVYDAETGTGNPPVRKAARQPTIHDVLTHRAGFTYGYFDLSPLGDLYRQSNINDPQADLSKFVTDLGKLPLKYDPGTKWHYAVSTDVLGRLVEVVSGQTFGAFLQTRIFDPLNMVDTGFKYAPATADRLAVLYSQSGITEQFGEKGFFARSSGPGHEPAHPQLVMSHGDTGKFESGGSGLLSTTHDYLRFARMLLNGGELDGVRLLAPATVALMRRDHVGDTEPLQRMTSIQLNEGIGFGLGFGVIKDQGLSKLAMPDDSFFWGGAAGTFFWIDPRNELIGMFVAQVVPHRTTLRQDMWGLTYQSILDDRLN